MLMYPTVRKGLITEPTSAPFVNSLDSVHIQDDQFLPDFSQEQYCQPRLLSPFQYSPDYQFASPPSSTPSSPTFSSPASSVTHPPSAALPDCSAVYDGNSLEACSMTPASSYNPSIQVQHSASPSTSQSYLPQYGQPYLLDTPMLAQPTVANNHSWEGNLQPCNPVRVPNGLRVPNLQDSQKASPNSFSSRSVPAGNPGSNFNFNQRPTGATAPKPLPTPVQTPVQNSFLTAPFQNYDPTAHDGNNNTEAEIAMRRAMMEQQQQQQQPRQSDYSLAPSVSSVSHNSPVTPQTNLDELDEASKAIANGEDQFPGVDKWMDEYLRLDRLSEYGSQNGNAMSIGIPKLNRTISDIYQDELYNPSIMPTPQGPKQATGQSLLGPYRNVFADRLQAANQGHMSARSQSPSMAINRERSPFRQTSHLATEFNNSSMQQPQLPTTMSMSQGGLTAGPQNNEPKTISPKDALLDFNEGEDTSMPSLFPPNQADFNLGDTLGLRRESSSSFRPPQNYSMDSFPGQYATHVAHQQYPFAQQQQQGPQPQQAIEFPTPLPSLESNGEMNADMGPGMPPIKVERPEDTTSDSGTYTCTYHGCTLRFETPSKLQKHKREAHRQTTPGGHLTSRDTAALRNSQAGPHKCERVNPSTGKPCNSVFSRPYDLTRHEDTIHNARKQKVRCHLCTEEKTFSRNDALTRHMRVVHPEVDWPGKQRRRGRD